jgi:hypothetical protein
MMTTPTAASTTSDLKSGLLLVWSWTALIGTESSFPFTLIELVGIIAGGVILLIILIFIVLLIRQARRRVTRRIRPPAVRTNPIFDQPEAETEEHAPRTHGLALTDLRPDEPPARTKGAIYQMYLETTFEEPDVLEQHDEALA